ncbi:TRAP transporter substrate-binding protein [Teichococcus aestuarii]|uniref:TRAP transporter substrate-binding protein n=1 Tax=Teichococcus aestuarii TaxID=568898 RepID=UPI0036139357
MFSLKAAFAAAALASSIMLPGGAFAQTVLKLGHVWPAAEIHARAAERFAADVAQATNGAVKVEIYGGSTLGSDRELVEGMRFGSNDIWVGGAGVLTAASDTAKIFAMPFMIRDAAHFGQVFNGPIGQEVTEAVRKESGLQILAYWLRGPRWLTTKAPVRSPADLSGLKIRVPDSPVSVASWKALGAAPTPMNFGEVFSALQQGVIDGQENPLSLIESSKFSEVVKYLVRTEHSYEPIVIVMSASRLNRLPEAQRKAVQASATGAAQAFAAEEVAKGETAFLRMLQEQRMTLIEPDKAPFRAKVGPAFVKASFPSIAALYEKVVAVGAPAAR